MCAQSRKKEVHVDVVYSVQQMVETFTRTNVHPVKSNSSVTENGSDGILNKDKVKRMDVETAGKMLNLKDV